MPMIWSCRSLIGVQCIAKKLATTYAQDSPAHPRPPRVVIASTRSAVTEQGGERYSDMSAVITPPTNIKLTVDEEESKRPKKFFNLSTSTPQLEPGAQRVWSSLW